MRLSRKKSFREYTINPCGSRSPYWDWVEKHCLREEDGGIREYHEANPDMLSESDHLYAAELTEGQQEKLDAVMAAWDGLSEKERLVLDMVGREGKTPAYVAAVLHLSLRSVRTYLTRASNKIAKVYRAGQTAQKFVA